LRDLLGTSLAEVRRKVLPLYQDGCRAMDAVHNTALTAKASPRSTLAFVHFLHAPE
jgi:hypothetical protein